MKKEQERCEKLREEAAAELLSRRAQMQQQSAQTLRELKAAEGRKEAERELRLSQWKESAQTSHALEIAKMQDVHRSQMKRALVDLLTLSSILNTQRLLFRRNWIFSGRMTQRGCSNSMSRRYRESFAKMIACARW